MSDSGEIVENCIEIIKAYKKMLQGNPSIHVIFREFPLKFHFCCGLYVPLFMNALPWSCEIWIKKNTCRFLI